MKILITGADGFVGNTLCPQLEMVGDFHVWRGVLAPKSPTDAPDANWIVTGHIGPDTAWADKLTGVDVVVHLAGRVHLLNDTAADPLHEFRQVNTEGTRHLAESAAKAGVKRFIFASSLHVIGEKTQDRPFTEDTSPTPHSPYAISKWEAEQALHQIAATTGMEVVIIRPPLVYGPGVTANFRALLDWAYRAMPLPLATVHNRRSFVGVRNLSSFIVKCMTHPQAANETFLISDGQDLSTTDLLRKAAHYLERPSRLFPMPVRLMEAGAKFLGKERMAQQLLSNLVVNSDKARQHLDWQPPYTVDEELAHTAQWYRAKVTPQSE